jgi:hypothetical protein
MATRLDQRIEQLEIIVEKCLDLCNVTCNGLRCTLPAQHEPTKLRKIPQGLSTDAKYAGRDRTLCRPGEPEQLEVREACSR